MNEAAILPSFCELWAQDWKLNADNPTSSGDLTGASRWLEPCCLRRQVYMAPGSTGHCFTGVEASSQAAQAPLMPSGSHKVSPVSLTFVLFNGALWG